MFSFSKRLFAYVFSLLFFGILVSSQKLFSFDYLIIETCSFQPQCQVCNKYIQPENYLVDKDGKQLKPYVYLSRNDFCDLVMCKNCCERDKCREYMLLINKFFPNFKPSDDLPNLLKNQLFISELPGLRLFMRFNGRYEKCALCKGGIDKFFEKIWYVFSNDSNVCVCEKCANKFIENNGKYYEICQKKCHELKLVNPYIRSIEGKKADIENFVKASYLKK